MTEVDHYSNEISLALLEGKPFNKSLQFLFKSECKWFKESKEI